MQTCDPTMVRGVITYSAGESRARGRRVGRYCLRVEITPTVQKRYISVWYT